MRREQQRPPRRRASKHISRCASVDEGGVALAPVRYLASAGADVGRRRRLGVAGLARSAVAVAHGAAYVVRGVVQRRFNLHCRRAEPGTSEKETVQQRSRCDSQLPVKSTRLDNALTSFAKPSAHYRRAVAPARYKQRVTHGSAINTWQSMFSRLPIFELAASSKRSRRV